MMPYRYLSIERQGLLLHFINAVSKKEVSFGTIFIIDLFLSIIILYFKISWYVEWLLKRYRTSMPEPNGIP